MSSAKILDGKWLSSRIQAEVTADVASLKASRGRAPGLGVILVGDNPASKAYVGNKQKLASACGLQTFDVKLPATASQAQVIEAVEGFNAHPDVHGILVQLPLPEGLDANEVISRIRPDKDADGLHPVNQGLLMRGEGELRPCTPAGCMRLIDLAFSKVESGSDAKASDIPRANLAGKTAVVIGRSILVGKPVGLLLLERNATVVMAHSKTKDLPSVARGADIIVAAVGVPGLVKGSWVKPGAVVIDVGINRTDDGKLTGDVDFAEASQAASAITPVPGGVGPMTVTMLICNTVAACKAKPV